MYSLKSSNKSKTSPITIKITKPAKYGEPVIPIRTADLTFDNADSQITSRPVKNIVNDEIPLGRPDSQPKVRYLTAALSSEERHARGAPQWTAGKIYERLCADTHMTMTHVKSRVCEEGNKGSSRSRSATHASRADGNHERNAISVKKPKTCEDVLSNNGSFSSQGIPIAATATASATAVSEKKKTGFTTTISIELPGYESYDADDDDVAKRKKRAERCCRDCGSPVPEHVCQFPLDL